MRKIVILDYGIGNVRSISNALEKVNAKAVLSDQPDVIQSADGVILPGVGAFAKGMENLKLHQLEAPIYEYVKSGKPFLGICLGMQMLMEESEEFGMTKGLGLIEGKVARLQVNTLRLPHVSWNEIEPPSKNSWENTPLSGIPVKEKVYFTHSFAAYPKHQENCLAVTSYDDVIFCSATQHDNVYGLQFHPEKSGNIGLEILKNFIKI